MPRLSRLLPALILGLALVPAAAFAQTGTPRIDQRQQNQEQRIDQGVSSGVLTGREARRLVDGFIAIPIERVQQVPASGAHHETARAERVGH